LPLFSLFIWAIRPTRPFILAIVFLSGALGFLAGALGRERGGKAAPDGPGQARVLRDGREADVPFEEVVPGDVLV